MTVSQGFRRIAESVEPFDQKVERVGAAKRQWRAYSVQFQTNFPLYSLGTPFAQSTGHEVCTKQPWTYKEREKKHETNHRIFRNGNHIPVLHFRIC
jgi:hypothetical protein